MINTIDDALDTIYSHVDYSMTHQKDISSNVFSLNAIQHLCESLGNPQKRYPVIHVAGTKGKGSVCAMLASALQNAGFKTGLYTSPHLIRFNERIQVDGKMISDQSVIKITERLIKASELISEKVSSFELMTAMAFEYFKDQKIDIAIVETGLGGRLDATNVVDSILTIITSVSIDHTGFLGNTLEKIAAEKAGIIKRGVPVICGCQPYPEAEKVIKTTSEKLGCPWISVADRFRFINQRDSENDSMLIWRVEYQKLMRNWCLGKKTLWKPDVIQQPLKGYHQLQNTAIVFAALNKLKSDYNHLDLQKAYEGIGKTFWPCRFETLCRDKLLIADGAHNSDSMQKLTAVLERCCGTRNITCIFGASEDKKLVEMIEWLAPHVDCFIMTRSEHPRAADPALLSQIAAGIGRKTQVAMTLEEAYDIYQRDDRTNQCYLVTGSLFVAGGIREIHMKNDPSLRYFDISD